MTGIKSVYLANIRSRPLLSDAALLILSFLWFWFWRPYGFYGGDSEYLDRQINGGVWFRKREPLAVAAMQLSHQIFTPSLGWPVSWSISFVSCLAGAVSVVILWRLCRNWRYPLIACGLILASGHALLYHGAIESYALPTCILSLWILAVYRVDGGSWNTAVLPACFAAMVWLHLIGLFLLPALLASAWIYRKRIKEKDWAAWLLALVAAAWVYVFTTWLNVGEGLGFEGVSRLFVGPEKMEEVGAVFSWSHIKMKLYFLWVGTHLTLPLAFTSLWKGRRDPKKIQMGVMMVCGLLFVIFFHPDCAYLDWDLFLLPSLPTAVLASSIVLESSRRGFWSVLWVAAFLSIWVPRVPVWARLSERGVGEVVIKNFPEDRMVHLDNRYPIRGNKFMTQGGTHILALKKRGELTRWKVFQIEPGDRIEVELPDRSAPVPFADRIRKLAEEDPQSDQAD